MSGGWREPTPAERALLVVLGRADAVGRAIAAQVERAVVRSTCGCGCGCLELRAPAGSARVPRVGRAYIVEAQGIDRLGRRALVSLIPVDGQLAELEIAPLASDEIASPCPESLVQLDAVPRGTLALHWMVPRTETILAEAARRPA